MTVNYPASLTPPADLLDAIRSLKRPAVLAHVTPDADALGSALGMGMIAQSLGFNPTAPLPSADVSVRLQFLLERSSLPIAPALADDVDGFIVLDTAKASRANIDPKLPEVAAGRPIINIDHHVSNTQFGQTNWVVPEASSTCELVFHLAGALNAWDALSADDAAGLADLLFAGIAGDTQSFTLPTTTPAVLSAAAELAARGANIAMLGQLLFRSIRGSEFELLKRVYANTHILAGGKLAYSTLTHDEITSAGCNANDIDAQIDVVRNLHGVEVAMLFSEGDAGITRVNVRSEGGNVPALDIAQHFDGGGHAAAAGILLKGDFDANVKKVVDFANAKVG